MTNKPFEVVIAEFSGFCFGVERAIGIVEAASAEKENVVTYGPIIHNPQVVASLEERNVNVIESAEDIKGGMTVIIRSHGIAHDDFKIVSSKNAEIIDATCPFVHKAQSMAQALSDECDAIVILGEEDHPEVKGIISYLSPEFFVVADISDALKLPFRNYYGFLAQTTQNNEIFEKISDILKKKCKELKVAKTICNATNRRQKASIELAANVEVMVVIGGRNSANTTRLYHLCKEICPKTYHIETSAELSKSVFAGVSRVGLTAGASTPHDFIKQVREYILEVSR